MLTVNPGMVTLTDQDRMACTNVSVLQDDLVEGRELFELKFETFNEIGSYSVNGSSSTVITIVDSNGQNH